MLKRLFSMFTVLAFAFCVASSLAMGSTNVPEGLSMEMPEPPKFQALPDIKDLFKPEDFRFMQKSSGSAKTGTGNTLKGFDHVANSIVPVPNYAPIPPNNAVTDALQSNMASYGLPDYSSANPSLNNPMVSPDPIVSGLMNDLHSTVNSASPSMTFSPFSQSSPFQQNGFDQSSMFGGMNPIVSGNMGDGALIQARSQQIAKMAQIEAAIRMRESTVRNAQGWLSTKERQIADWIRAQTNHATSILEVERTKVKRLEIELKNLVEQHTQIAEWVNSVNMEMQRKQNVIEMEKQKQALDIVSQKENNLRQNWEETSAQKSGIQDLLKKSMDEISQSNALTNAVGPVPSNSTPPIANLPPTS